MPAQELTDTTALVTGASSGFGRATTVALHNAGANVVAVARNAQRLDELRDELGGSLTTVTADVADPVVAGSLLEQHRPKTLVLNAGAAPLMRPLQHHTWDTFNRNWEVDVRQAFHWIREAQLLPLAPQSTVIALSSGAALFGSPLSGGYAGAKATQRFITGYAQDEARRAGLDIRFMVVLPRITPLTDVGRPAVRAYALRNGQTEEKYLQGMGVPLRPEAAGAAVVELLHADPATLAPGYLLSGAGLKELPDGA